MTPATPGEPAPPPAGPATAPAGETAGSAKAGSAKAGSAKAGSAKAGSASGTAAGEKAATAGETAGSATAGSAAAAAAATAVETADSASEKAASERAGGETAEPARQRDPYVDFLRAFSLLIVVLWHWAFTILEWGPDGPHATSPLGFTRGLWLATWLLQVMPLFFFVGGFVHLITWDAAQKRGVRIGQFVWRRMRQLLVPAGTVLIVWIALGSLIGTYFNLQGYGQVVKLIVSPLWFLGVYLGLIMLLPISLWLHRKAGVLVLVWLGGGAMLVDVLRFHDGLVDLAWLNMVLVWGLCHQAGFFYQRMVDAPRHNDWAFLWTGLFGLVGLVGSGLYPGSMVGVPGERFSNVGPPTFIVVALLLFQIGVVELLRPRMQVLLERRRWKRANTLINDFALPLYLVHTTGMALFLFLVWLTFGLEMQERANVDAGWWLTRPLAIIGPLVCTIPVLWLFRWLQRRGPWRRRGQPSAVKHGKESETAIAS